MKKQQGMEACFTFTRPFLNSQWICNHQKVSYFSLRVNLDSVQSETSALLKRLNEAAKKVSNSVEDLKEQYAKVLEVCSFSTLS